jgi:hypothetical protein
MSKDDDVRISDTITFIRTATVPPGRDAKRGIVADLLHDLDLQGRISDLVSPAMSQGSNYAIVGRDEAKANRHYRRAIILIRMALQNSDRSVAPRETNQITDANLAQELGNRLDQVCTTLDDLTTKLDLLKSNPVQFLKNNAFNMVSASGKNVPSGVMDYVFYDDALNGQYTLAAERDVNNIVTKKIKVFHLHVQPYAGLAKTRTANGESLDVVGNIAQLELMVTTQLTGCAIVYYLQGATLVAAHVQPTGGIIAEAMCTNLRDDATLSNAPGLAKTGVFGAQAAKGGDPNNYLKAGNYNFCVGVRIGGTWGLYAQERVRGKGGAKDSWIIATG